MRILSTPLLFALGLLASVLGARADVLINELMYHPQSELAAEEWIELYNSGAASVDLSGWKFTSGVTFTFPSSTSIAAGGYLVVTANPAAFHLKYPAVTKYVSQVGWAGQLSNSSNKVVLADSFNAVKDTVSYSDDGDWGVRKQDVIADDGHKGWGWESAADGLGSSLELINVAVDNNLGQNWAPSSAAGGTPGLANSQAKNDIAPVILDVIHFPLVPAHGDSVAVTAQVLDEQISGVAVTLRYRNDGAAAFTSAPMFDDGLHGDALPNDRVYGALIPPQVNGTIVEFYVQAQDAGTKVRTWPAPSIDSSGLAGQFCNGLYQVDDTVYAGVMPLYRLIMKQVDKDELIAIHGGSASHAKVNTTWITTDGTSNEVRYLSGTRNRGHGSASANPQGLNIAFTNENTWKGVTTLNLNSQQTYAQLFGSALMRKSGLSAPTSRPIQLRWNAADPSLPGTPSFGFYVANEVADGDFAANHFPLDSGGNVYRAQRFDGTAPANTMADAYLEYLAPAAGQQPPDPYRTVFFKNSNSSEDNWSDLIGLTQALAKGHSDASYNTAYDADYVTSVQAAVDVEEWMRFFAAEALIDNSESNIWSGYGDDYNLYFGTAGAAPHDPRAKLVPYDLDTICGQGDTRPTPIQHDLFRMIRKDDNTGGGAPVGPTPMNAFIKNPAFAPIYYKQLKQLIDGPFAKANFDALVDSVLTGVVPQAQITSIKNFQSKLPTTPGDPKTGGRTGYLASLIPLNISVTTGPAALNGYPHTTTPAADLTGTANAINTRSVKVNGAAAVWTAWTATWSAPAVALVPGINKILIQNFDDSNVELERFTYSVWYDDATVAIATGTLAADATWTAANGPYRLTSNLIVPAGRTLTIQPGTTIYCATGATGYSITVNGTGKINAVGTDLQRIVFTREPTATVNWKSLDFINTTVQSTLSYVTFENCGGTTIGSHEAQVHSNNAIVFFDHFTFPPTPVIEYLSFDAASFIVQNSIFPTYPAPTGPESLHGVNGIMTGGHGIFRDNYFGHTWGFNDTIDFTGGNRPGPILQIINNVFDGASDDCVDLDSTDAWIEGNIFMHVHRDPTRTDQAIDTGSAISGGVDTVGQNADWTIINNLFYDVDHVFLNKGNSTTVGNAGGRVAFLYNTVSHVAKEGSGSTAAEIAAFDWTDDNVVLPDASIGSGMYAAHNIVNDCTALHFHYDPAHHTVIMDNNILSVPWTGAGSNNRVIDPRLNLDVLNGTPVANVTAEQLRQAFQLLPGSPAIGAGFGGRNIGGLSAHGIAIAGEPIGTTNATTATLTVGPGGTFNWGTIATQAWGWTAYKWKLDNGAYSAEIPVVNNPPFTAPATISLTGLSNGAHTVSVIGKNDNGFYQDDTFLYPLGSGTPAAATVSKTWTVNTAYVPPAAQPNVRINEVLAKNGETQGFSGVFPDMIELYNAGGATETLTGWGLTDNATIPYKYTFPATTLAPGAYLVIYADSSSSVPLPRTGFSLKQTGDTLTLTKPAAQGGGTQDSVPFGSQLSDYSIGRRSDGAWDLCVPTFGTLNIVAAQSKPGVLKINEWLTDARTLFADDFIELFNPSSLPVNIGGGYLTDNPVEWPARSQIRQLTFLAPGGFASFKADGNIDSGADHLSFKLSPTGGEIGLFNAGQQLIDSVVYGSQSTDVSEGRSPNGGAVIVTFNQPTPGAGNPGGTTPGSTTTTAVNIIPATQVWKYYPGITAEPPVDAQSRPFSATAYIDTTWASGAQLLYIETAALTNTEGFVKTTLLTGYAAAIPYQTYYFRTHFTYTGSLSNLSLSAKIMVDDGCVLYLNGQELLPVSGVRVGMDPGPVVFATRTNRSVDATVETLDFPADLLVVGDNVLSVEVHQSNTQTPTTGSSDITFGMKLDAVTTTIGNSSIPVVINEVLARNTVLNPDGSTSGWIELYNPATTSYDLSDMSLTNEVDMPRKWVVPAGTLIAADGYLTVYCNGLLPASTTNAAAQNTGFGLSGSGEAIYLFKKIADGANLLYSLPYGLQVPNFSVSRVPNGTGPFVLCQPTKGALNDVLHVAGTANITGAVKINEWMSNPAPLPGPIAQPGWFELYNSAAQPVLLSGNFLTDNLTAGNRTKYEIPPLSYIGSGANGWVTLIADNAAASSGHVNFALDKAGESIALYSGNQVQIDVITYAPQYLGVSSGRFADGSATILPFFGTPTPGAMNVFSLDIDADGIPSEWEAAHGLDWNNPADAGFDADSDGQSNLAEYNAATDPFSAASKFTLGLSGPAAGQMHIQFFAQASKSYSIQYKASLTDAVWTKLTDVAPQSAAHPVDVPDSFGAAARRFYRVITPAQP